MDRFELSERWAPWRDLEAIFSAAHAAVAAGPLEPPLCEIVFNEEFDPFVVDTLAQAQEDLRRNPNMMSMDLVVSHRGEDQAQVSLHYNCARLQLVGGGRDWNRARAAYDAAQAVLSGSYGVTTPKLPARPADTAQPADSVAETRERLDAPVAGRWWSRKR